MILAATIYLFLILWWDVYTDVKKWRKAQAVKHGSEWVLRVCLTLPAIILFTVAHPAESGYNWGTFWVLLNTVSMIGFTWWLIFDGWYNLSRRSFLKKSGAAPVYYQKFTFFYTGSFNEEGHSDSWLDKLQFWIGAGFSKVLKVTGAAVSITVYVISFYA